MCIFCCILYFLKLRRAEPQMEGVYHFGQDLRSENVSRPGMGDLPGPGIEPVSLLGRWTLCHQTSRKALKFLIFDPPLLLFSWSCFISQTLQSSAVIYLFIYFSLAQGIPCLLWHGFSLVLFSGCSEGHKQSHNRKGHNPRSHSHQVKCTSVMFLVPLFVVITSCICSQTP